MLIDDEAGLPFIIKAYLEDETEFHSKIAPTGEDALALCDTSQPDICIVDMRLPGMSGNEFILAAHQKMPNCKFIIHTGSLDYQIPQELRAIEIHENAILFKPVMDMVQYIRKIEELLEL